MKYWLNVCDRARTHVEMYSDNFLQTFGKSEFFTICKKTVEGKFQWNEWSECSLSCGEGVQTRIAISCVPEYTICYDIPIIERSCNEQACPIGQWTWNDWTECTASCGGGLRYKSAQSCEPFGAECKDIPVVKESCNTAACPSGQLTWNDWSECSKSCGGGIRIKTANECLPSGAICEEVPIKEESCNENACPEGQWNWNPWSECSASCGGGIRIRTPNSCVPENVICSEVPILEETCNEDKCPIGIWTWNDWGDCSNSCGGGIRIKTADKCIPEGSVCHDVSVVEEPCNTNTCPHGQWIWNDWSECSSSCGGGIKIKTASKCVPEGASCDESPIKEGNCNENACPEVPSSFLPVGTIISWVPRPNESFPNNVYFDDDTWVECDGKQTCTKGRFAGQVCSDLKDRVLVGAGKTGSLLQIKDASLPDHAHSHKHTGTHNYNVRYRTGPVELITKYDGHLHKAAASAHNHDVYEDTTVTIDFGYMNSSEAFISRITNPKVSKSTAENDLYSPHMRVTFMFKCH